jgi:hypothetical protein
MSFAILFFPGRWISHKVEKKEKAKVKQKFGSALQQDENIPIVESVSSESLSS